MLLVLRRQSRVRERRLAALLFTRLRYFFLSFFRPRSVMIFFFYPLSLSLSLFSPLVTTCTRRPAHPHPLPYENPHLPLKTGVAFFRS